MLVRATRHNVFTLEELSTIFCQIKSIFNSSPLSYQANNSLEILTPDHFLISENFLSLPIHQVSPEQNLSKRFKLLPLVINFFWREWSTSYLNCLQRRNKWPSAKENFKINDLVIVKFDKLTLLKWPLGLLLKLFLMLIV